MKSLRLASLVVVFWLHAGIAAGTEVTLFYTPAERARVTAERSGMLVRDSGAGGAIQSGSFNAIEAAPAAKAEAPRLEGVSLPADGRAHAWIGGRRYQDGELFQGQRVRVVRNGVQLTGASGSMRLYKVGEAIRGAAGR